MEGTSSSAVPGGAALHKQRRAAAAVSAIRSGVQKHLMHQNNARSGGNASAVFHHGSIEREKRQVSLFPMALLKQMSRKLLGLLG